MTDAFMLDAPKTVAPWAAENFQVSKYGSRYYADTLPPCDLIADPHAEPVPGFSSLKPSKPFRKSVTVGDRKYTVPLDWYRAGEWLADNAPPVAPFSGDKEYHAFYQACHQQRDRDFARGHAIHSAAEAALVGQGVLNVNPDAAPYIPHLTKWIEDNVTDVHAIEAVVFGDGYGGTGDAWVNVRGVSVYLDWKSRGADSAHGIYEEEIAQGGAYTSARYCILPSDDRERAVRAPLPAATYGLVLSLRPDGVEEFWYDLALARESFNYMHRAYQRTSDAGKAARAAKVKDPTGIQETAKRRKKATVSEAREAIQSVAEGTTDISQPQLLLAELKSYDVEVHLEPVTDPLNGQRHIDLTVKLPGKTKRSYGWAATDKGKADVLNRAIADVRRALKIPIGYTPAAPPPRTAPDEGRTGVGVDSLRDKYKALDPAARSWVEAKEAEARTAGVTFHLSTATERRAWIMSALMSLAVAELDDDDTVKAIARHVTGDDACEWPTVTAGHAVGSLDAVQAKAFRDLALVFASGMGVLEFDDLGAKVAA